MVGLFIDERKVRAAASSMHQFYPLVRNLYDHEVSNVIVETATTFLYLRLATEVFGRRFVDKMGPWMPDRLKYSSAEEIRDGVKRLTNHVDTFVSSRDEMLDCYSYESDYAHHIRAVIKAMFTEARTPMDDPEIVVVLEGDAMRAEPVTDLQLLAPGADDRGDVQRAGILPAPGERARLSDGRGDTGGAAGGDDGGVVRAASRADGG